MIIRTMDGFVLIGLQASKARLSEVKAELSAIKDQLQPLKLKYEKEKGRVTQVQEMKKKLEGLKAKMAVAERAHDLGTAADYKYYAIPETEKKLAQLVCNTLNSLDNKLIIFTDQRARRGQKVCHGNTTGRSCGRRANCRSSRKVDWYPSFKAQPNRERAIVASGRCVA